MREKRRGIQRRQESVPLDAGGIDRLSQLLVETLTQAEADRKDILRLRLALEDALALWLPVMPAGSVCTFRCGARLGRMFAEVSVPGPRSDPAELDQAGGSLYSGLTAQAGLALTWQYRDGANCLTVCPPRRQRLSSLAQLILSFGAAAACGAALLAAPVPVRAAAAGIVDPLFSAMMGVLQALAGPMIFLSVCCGILAIGVCLACPLVYALLAALRLGASWPMLLRKELPAYLIALATASSSAALSTNLETCQRRLGISPRIGNFAVPLGQVVFKPGAAAGFLLLAFGLAEFYGVAMSPAWVVTGVLVSGMLAAAAPPIPGGSLTCYTVLLTQLGIPEEGIALAIAANVILDFFMTSCGIACLQSALAMAAGRLGMLDRAILQKE